MESVPTKDSSSCTSLGVQWLRTHLPMQGTQVQSLAQEEDSSAERQLTKPNTLISQALECAHTGPSALQAPSSPFSA